MTEMARLYGWLSPAFRAAIPWAELAYGIVESPSHTTLVAGPEADSLAAEEYDRGVLFGPRMEWRWRRCRSGQFRVVCVCDGEAVGPADVQAAALTVLVGREQGLPEQYLLWGEPSGAAGWHESRIPRLITEYPAAFAGRRLAVGLRHYQKETVSPLPGGRSITRPVLVTRFTGIQAVEEERKP